METTHAKHSSQSKPASGGTWRRLLPLLILVAGVWGLMRIVYQPPGPPSLVGSQAPPLQAETFAGASLDLAALRGKGVLLNFWASWCGPCRAEAALLEQAWSVLATPATDADQKNTSTIEPEIIFAGIAHMDTMAGSLRFLETYNITYPNAPDPTGHWAEQFGVAGIPETFFIGPDGIVRSQVRGPLLDGSDLQERLDLIRPSP